MRFTKFLIFCGLVIFSDKGMALRCRNSEQHETNDRFERAMQRCKARMFNQNQYAGAGNSPGEDSDSDQDDSYDDSTSSDSEEKNSNSKFMNGRIGTTDASSTRISGSNYNRRDQNMNGGNNKQNFGPTSRPYPYNRMSNGSYGANNPELNNDKLSRNMTLRSGNYNGMGNSGRDDMQTNRQDQACTVQCFFDELDLTDQKGFPEKFSVAKIMKENIRDSELQNFVERAVMDCFNVIDADRNKEPCKSSQYLLNCLASKGRERCDDWNM